MHTIPLRAYASALFNVLSKHEQEASHINRLKPEQKFLYQFELIVADFWKKIKTAFSKTWNELWQ